MGSGPNCDVRASIVFFANECCTARASAATTAQSTCHGIPYTPQEGDPTPYKLTECKDGVAYATPPASAPAPAPAPAPAAELSGSKSIELHKIVFVVVAFLVV